VAASGLTAAANPERPDAYVAGAALTDTVTTITGLGPADVLRAVAARIVANAAGGTGLSIQSLCE
jgi:hypothetical protein